MYAHWQAGRFEKSPLTSPPPGSDGTRRRRVDWAAAAPLLIGGPLAFTLIVALAWSLSYLLYL